jgi:hypothetical protein
MMDLFGKKAKKEMEDKKALEVLLGLTFSSKAALKKHCMLAYNGNIAQAKEAYDFLVDGMENLPDIDPTPPSTIEQVKGVANGLVGWIGQNQGTIIDTVNTVRGLFSKVSQAAEEAGEVVIEDEEAV